MSTRPAENELPDYVRDLEASYGPPSDAGFGSAVFFEPELPADAVDREALDTYQRFVGRGWQAREAGWMSAWKRIYLREAGRDRDVIAELRGLSDVSRSCVSLILDAVDNPAQAQKALAAAMDDPSVSHLSAYSLGDGEAMSGLLVCGRRNNGETTFVLVLLD